jgi:uroporphyrinogen-III synthase
MCATLPLTGRRVLVTRAAQQMSKLSAGLRALGGEAIEVPVLEICAPKSFAPLDLALRQLHRYHWLILTSANAVRVLSERTSVLGMLWSVPGHLKVAAVGEATAEAARKAGLPVAFVPQTYVAEALVECLVGQAARQRILLARAEIARDLIPDALRAAGAEVDVVDAYRNRLPEAAPRLLKKALAKRIDAAMFTSSSSVTHLAAAAKQAGIAFPFAGVQAMSIGPITSATLRDMGWVPAAEATVSNIAGLIQAVELALR